MCPRKWVTNWNEASVLVATQNSAEPRKQTFFPACQLSLQRKNSRVLQVCHWRFIRAGLMKFKMQNIFEWSSDFFVLAGESLNAPLPDRLTLLPNDRRDYEVHLFDAIGRTYRLGITLRNSDQSVDVRFKITLTHRWRMVTRGLITIAGAFKVYR